MVDFVSRFIGILIVGIIIMAIVIGILFVAVPQARLFLANRRRLIVIILGGALLMSVMFTVPMLTAASLIGLA